MTHHNTSWTLNNGVQGIQAPLSTLIVEGGEFTISHRPDEFNVSFSGLVEVPEVPEHVWRGPTRGRERPLKHTATRHVHVSCFKTLEEAKAAAERWNDLGRPIEMNLYGSLTDYASGFPRWWKAS